MDHRQRLHAARATVEHTDSIAWLAMPSAQGLNESRLQQAAALFDQLAADPHVQTIALQGTTEVFLSGADLPFFVRSIVSGDIERVLRFTQSAHQWLARIEGCPKPVVAWIEGVAFGAGLELSLACHTIIASSRARFALPETTLGIYPGMGGTQRLPRRIGGSLAKWMVFTGAIVPAAQAMEIGLVDAVTAQRPSAEDLMAITRRRELPCFTSQTRFDLLQRFFGEHSVAELLDASMAQPSQPELIRALIQLRNNGPIALRLAERLIDQGLTMSLEEGIQQEFSSLQQVFATEDALNGLLTFGKSRATFADS